MKIKIEFEVEIEDVDYAEDELEEYLRYMFRDNGSMSTKNPFYEQGEPQPIFGTFMYDVL
jgi:hypothetical protein